MLRINNLLKDKDKRLELLDEFYDRDIFVKNLGMITIKRNDKGDMDSTHKYYAYFPEYREFINEPVIISTHPITSILEPTNTCEISVVGADTGIGYHKWNGNYTSELSPEIGLIKENDMVDIENRIQAKSEIEFTFEKVKELLINPPYNFWLFNKADTFNDLRGSIYLLIQHYKKRQ